MHIVRTSIFTLTIHGLKSKSSTINKKTLGKHE